MKKIFRNEIPTITKEKINELRGEREILMNKYYRFRQNHQAPRWLIELFKEATEKEVRKIDNKTFFFEELAKPRSKKIIDIMAMKKEIKIAPFLPEPDYRKEKRKFYKCIFHNEKTASMMLNEDANNVYCFGCGKLGSIIDVVMALNNMNFKEAVKYLSNIR